MTTNSTDGRIQIRAGALKKAGLMGMAVSFIRTQPGVLRVTPDNSEGGILIEYDTSRLSREAVERALAPFAMYLSPESGDAVIF
jgi:hypothetical protein